MQAGAPVTRVIRAPLLVLRWIGVVVGVVGWLLLVPLLEVGRSLARPFARMYSGRRPRRASDDPAAGTPVELTAVVERPEPREAPRRVGSG
jgi:hypothetical protein